MLRLCCQKETTERKIRCAILQAIDIKTIYRERIIATMAVVANKRRLSCTTKQL